MRRTLAIALLVASACQSPTVVKLSVVASDGQAATDNLTLQVFSPYRQLLDPPKTYAGARLPGELVLVPSDLSPLRLLVGSGVQSAITRVTPRAGETTAATVVLRGTSDCDNDTIPDEIDNCIGTANPNQADRDGNGVGDACDLPGSGLRPCARGLCEDFESALSLPCKWAQQRSGADVDSSRAHSGSASLHVHGDAQALNLDANVSETGVEPAPDVFVRAFYWVGPEQQARPTLLSGLVFHDAGGAQYVFGIGWGADGNVRRFTTPTETGSLTSFKFGQWVCIEWQLSHWIGGGAPTLNAWIDGTPVELGDAGVTAYPELREIFLGTLGLDVGATPLDFWIDDVVIDSQPISCTL
jgi:hypothetical protein